LVGCVSADLPTTWQVAWISPTAEPTPPGRRPAYRLRGTFSSDRPVRRATLFATAHGIYEAELNGVRVGDEELTPGYTEYQHHTQVQSYDVADLLHGGENVLDALLADGWHRGQVGVGRAHDQWGTRTPSERSEQCSVAIRDRAEQHRASSVVPAERMSEVLGETAPEQARAARARLLSFRWQTAPGRSRPDRGDVVHDHATGSAGPS
jgi:hypothetical protein